MFVKFTLTMPNVGSWNGQWSGADAENVQVRNYTKKYHQDKINKIFDWYEENSHTYNFSDGWVARIDCEVIDSKEKNRIKKIDHSFSGYNWMIDSIEKNGKIILEGE